MRSVNAIPFVALVAALATVPAHAEWYGAVQAGNAAVDQPGSYGVSGLRAAFGGPTVDHSICGGTAVITVGAEPIVSNLNDSSTDSRIMLGWRKDRLAFEFGWFNVAQLVSEASAGPYSVVQPTCTSGSFTVEAQGVKVEGVSFSGEFFAPVYSIPLAEKWSLDLRGNLAVWHRADHSQWQVVVTEVQSGTPFRTYPTTWVNGNQSESGVDVGLGIGVSWQMRADSRINARVEEQTFGPVLARSYTLGVAIDF